VLQVAVSLNDGQRYLPALDDLLAKENFESAWGRAAALRRLAHLLRPDDVRTHLIKCYEPGVSPGKAANLAEEKHRRYVRLLAIQEAVGEAKRGSEINDETACILLILIVIPASRKIAKGAIRSLRCSRPRLTRGRFQRSTSSTRRIRVKL
jgi:hypothetical protein